MKKKRLIRTLTLFFFLLVLTVACFWDKRPMNTAGKKQEEKTAAEQIKIQSTETGDGQAAQLKEQEQAVLIAIEKARAGIFAGYPVDEPFFGWLASHYGTETLMRLTEQMEQADAGQGLWYDMLGKSIHVVWSEYCRDYYASEEWKDILWMDAADQTCIRLDFAGDINFAADWCTMEAAGDASRIKDCISPDIKNELQSADFTMVNNEFVYTVSEEAQDKDYIFRAEPETVEALEVFGADMVSVANNHVFDYGEQGFLDTLETLKKNKMVYSGGGRNLKEAAAVRYVITGGRKIAIVSATEIERFSHYTKKAKENTPGVLKTQQKKTLQAAIKTAQKNSDYVIAYLHWGSEGMVHYDKEQTAIAEFCVEAGADAIIGGHTHRLQGVSFIKGVPVAYSLGNFWFSTGSLYTAVAQVQIDEKGTLTLRMLPCIQRNTKTMMLDSDEEKKEFYHYLADVSSGVGIDEDGTVHAYKNVNKPGESPYAYTSGRRYGQRLDNVDQDMHLIDFVGNLSDSLGR